MNKSSFVQRKKISEIEKKCEESLNEILRSANEATEISKKAEEELQHQTEQIKHINKETECIEENLKQSEQHLLGIKHWWRNINSLFGFDSYDDEQRKEKQKRQEKEAKSKHYVEQKNSSIKEKHVSKREYEYQLYKNTLDSSKEKKENESFQDKYEKDLNSLSVMLDELHSRALIMGNTINEQNQMLNKVNEKMETNIEKIVDQQKMMKEIMKK